MTDATMSQHDAATGDALRQDARPTRPVTELESKETMHPSEQLFQCLVQSVHDYAIFMLDTDGVISSWNSGAEAIKQYRADEIIGRHFSIFYGAEDVARGKPENELRTALTAGHVEDEGWRVRKDGSLFWANVTISAVYDSNGRHLGFAKVTRDMSERWRLEALEQSSGRMNEFLAMLGHELRNPLAPIRNAVSIMQMDTLENMGTLRCVNVIDRQLRHLTRLVDDLLDIGRISSGKIVLRNEPLPVAAVIARASEMAEPQFRARGQQFQRAHVPDTLWLQGDEVRLVQAVHNLLDNAAKFTGHGGHIRLDVELEGGAAVHLIVSDDGRGIPEGEQESIFNLFVRGETRADHSMESGLGLGLTLVRSVAELHGGAVSVQSAGAGCGSRFVLHLPLRSAPTDLVSHPATPLPRVLVVDDNVDAADSLGQLLSMLGHSVRVAYGGEQALRLMQQQPASHLLLDIGMPGMDGYELATRLRALPNGQDLTLVAITGYGQSADQQRAVAAGFDLHLVKPVDIDVLKQVLAG